MALSGEKVTQLSLSACGVGSVPIKLSNAEKLILEGGLAENSMRSAGRAAAIEVEPETDLHATSDYRRRLIGVLVHQALSKAKERAQGNN